MSFFLSINFCTTYPTRGHGEPGAYPKGLRDQGKGQPEWNAILWQGTIAHTYCGQFRDDSRSTMHVFGLGRKPEYAGETLEAHGVDANSMVREQRFTAAVT